MKEQESYIAAVKSFNRYLELHRMRKTPERFAILKKVWQQSHHFNADALHAALEGDGYHVSRATVFNTIELLVDSGVLRRHQFGSGKSVVYEAARGSHLHLICTRCGKVRELSDRNGELAGLITQRCSTSSFEPAYCNAYVHGICGQCARKMRVSAKETKNKDH